MGGFVCAIPAEKQPQDISFDSGQSMGVDPMMVA
jgi:hypothetical protein